MKMDFLFDSLPASWHAWRDTQQALMQEHNKSFDDVCDSFIDKHTTQIHRARRNNPTRNATPRHDTDPSADDDMQQAYQAQQQQGQANMVCEPVPTGYAGKANRTNTDLSPSEKFQNFKCHDCGKYGHIQRYCPERPENKPSSAPAKNADTQRNATNQQGATQSKWDSFTREQLIMMMELLEQNRPRMQGSVYTAIPTSSDEDPAQPFVVPPGEEFSGGFAA